MKQRELKRQPRAKAMLPAIKELVTRRALENKDSDRTLLAHELVEEIQRKFPKEIPPTPGTLIKKISEIRSHHDISPIDEPWSMAVLNRLHELDIYDIDARAVSAIMQVQNYLNTKFRPQWQSDIKAALLRGRDDPNVDPSEVTDEMIEKTTSEYPVLTIRQAKWVARLYRLQENVLNLYHMAAFYSDHEIISEMSGTPLNTDLLDEALFDWSSFRKLIDERGDSIWKATSRSFRRTEGDQ